MYTPTLVDIQLTNLPRALAPSALTPAPSLRDEEEGAIVNCIKVCGTSTITYTCEEIPPELEAAEDSMSGGAATTLPKKFLCAGNNFLRFHAHPSTVTLASIKVMCGKRAIKVESVKPLFEAPTVSDSSASASDAKKVKAGGAKASSGGKGGSAASSAQQSQATSSDFGLFEVKLGEVLPTGAAAIGQNVQLVAQFSTLCRPATPHGTIGMYYYTSSGNTSNSNNNYVATTHFEVTHARRAFPCVDDIEVRTRWKINVGFDNSNSKSGANASQQPIVFSCAAQDDAASSATTFAFQPLSTPIPAYAFAFLASSTSDSFITFTSGDDGKDRSMLTTDRGTQLATRVLVGSSFHAQHSQLGPFGLSKLHEAVIALEDLFDARLPLEDKLDLVFMGKMTPALAGMEHHGLIYIADSVWTGGPLARSTAGGPKQRDEITSLIIHELCHHWLGNAIGMPFAFKEGLCQVLEVCVLDVLEGKPIRKLAANMADASSPSQQSNSSAATPSTSTSCAENPRCNHKDGKQPAKAGKTENTTGGSGAKGGATVSQASEGKELTGLTYQKAFAEMAAVAADWEKFVQGLRNLVSQKMGEYVTGEEVSSFFE